MALVYKSALNTYIQGVWGNSSWTFKFYAHFLRHPAIVFCMHCAVVRQTIMFAKWLSRYMHSLFSFVWSFYGKTHQAFASFLPLSFCFPKGACIYSVRLSKSTWSWLLIRKKQWYQVGAYLDSRRLKISPILTNSSPKLPLDGELQPAQASWACLFPQQLSLGLSRLASSDYISLASHGAAEADWCLETETGHQMETTQQVLSLW